VIFKGFLANVGDNNMFTGEYRCPVDRAGLFALPAPVQVAFQTNAEELSRSVVLLKSLDRCLWLYRTQDWEAKLCTLRQQLDDQQSRLLMHYMVAQSLPSAVDANGRLAIPPPLMEYASIKDEVVIIGLYDRLELWSPSHWEDYILQLEDQHTSVLEKIVSLL
jgi:MraZ protein